MFKRREKIWIRKTESFYLASYSFLMRWRFTRKHVADIRHIYEILRPEKEETIICHTMKFYVLQLFFSVLILVIGACFFQKGCFGVVTSVFLIWIINGCFFHELIWREEKKLLFQLEEYLGIVRHFYHHGGNVEESIFDAIWETETDIRFHMGRFYETLVSDSPAEQENYRETAPDKYFFTFFSICQIIREFGDIETKKESLFLKNINTLKKEIRIERIKREQLEHQLSGLFFITVFPAFFLNSIAHWGISNLPELKKYYNGGYGLIVSVLIFFLIYISYSILKRLKEGHFDYLYERKQIFGKIAHRLKELFWIYDNRFPKKVDTLKKLLRKTSEKLTWEELLVKSILFFLLFLFLGSVVLGQSVRLTRNNMISFAGDYKSSAFLRKGELAVAQDAIVYFNQDYKEKKISQERLKGRLTDYFWTKGKVLYEEDAESLGKEIEKRVERAGEYHSFFWEKLLLLLFCCIGFKLPEWKLCLKQYWMQREMEDEVGQFHSILIMLRAVKRMDTGEILKWFEAISTIFRPSITECLDAYDYDGFEALHRLKENETFPPFCRLVEDLEACDQVGTWKAFDEIEGQREFFLEKRKQDNEILVADKGVMGKAIAFLPLILTIGLYLIVPFVLESIRQLGGYLAEVNI